MAALTQVPVQVYDVRGDTVTLPPSTVSQNRNPGINDLAEVGSMWVNYLTNSAFILTSTAGASATWTDITQGGIAGPIDTIQTDGQDVNPVAGVISLLGDGVNVTVDGINSNITVILTDTPTFTTVASTATLTAGTGITSTLGNITASAGNLVSSVGSVSAATTVTAGTGITSITGNITASTGSFIASDANNGFVFSNGVKILSGSGDPNGALTAPIGSLYLNHTGNGVANRMFINSDAGTTWVSITSAS